MVTIDLPDGSGASNRVQFINTHFAYVVEDAESNANLTVEWAEELVANGTVRAAGQWRHRLSAHASA